MLIINETVMKISIYLKILFLTVCFILIALGKYT